MSVKINQFELENVKRIKAVKVELSENGLTVIGGRNGQGKTSILIASRGPWAAIDTDLQRRNEKAA